MLVTCPLPAESIGWIPLEDRAYLHVGSQETEIIEVVGIPTAEMQGLTGYDDKELMFF